MASFIIWTQLIVCMARTWVEAYNSYVIGTIFFFRARDQGSTVAVLVFPWREKNDWCAPPTGWLCKSIAIFVSNFWSGQGINQNRFLLLLLTCRGWKWSVSSLKMQSSGTLLAQCAEWLNEPLSGFCKAFRKHASCVIVPWPVYSARSRGFCHIAGNRNGNLLAGSIDQLAQECLHPSLEYPQGWRVFRNCRWGIRSWVCCASRAPNPAKDVATKCLFPPNWISLSSAAH